MSHEWVAIWVQAAATLVALGGSGAALVIAAMDRRNAQRIAAEDRRQVRLSRERELLLRASELLRRRGDIDIERAKDRGAELGSILSALGPDRMPSAWAKHVKLSDAEALAIARDEDKEWWIRAEAEAHLALGEVGRELQREAPDPTAA
ncbi:hypothetical protein GCM10011512_29280 [Tersicoccus solisilvae]|uniref:Uncharacterized protein n=1 Tax=Tersicoccus solisilvae TaxID=1882339 RepID=A0ABQ1PPL1_9MICC|nr:hypothetical protein [Tersicoccus solisilvae]GGD00548.1 hypothetical protein GCM10011512_29280 [Tersicoccus solisilvae]